MLLGEAVVRLLRRQGNGRGSVLVVEDLHWADPETLAALDHIGDAVPDQPVLCLCTTRPAGAAAETLDRLARREGATTIRVEPLAPSDVLGVTSREVDVLKLVASGLSNREIAARLVLSTKTVDRHLGNLFDRTGVHTRGALGELARAHGVQDG
jgi:DNA-binding CsgD family transcriptional regulator